MTERDQTVNPLYGKRLSGRGAGPPASDQREAAEDHLNAALDPSVLLAVPALQRVRSELPALQQRGIRFVVAPTFLRAVESRTRFRQLSLFLGRARPARRAAVRSTIGELGIAAFELPEWAPREFGGLVESFSRPPLRPMEAQILFEEWYYLAHYSALAARTRRVVQQLAERSHAGAIELVGRTTPLIDRAMRRTLRKGDKERISQLERLKAIAKWVAIGGDVAIPFLPPELQASWAALNAPFVIFDP